MADNALAAQDVEPADHTEGKAELGRHLSSTFAVYKKDRKVAEEQWMTNLRQYLGKYDPEYEQKMAPNTSRAYPKRTRVKCVSMRSRLMDLLFPASEKNWSLEASSVPTLPTDTLTKALGGWQLLNPGVVPTQQVLDKLVHDTAKSIAERYSKLIDDQLMDVDPYGTCDYETLAGKVVSSAVLYGPGIAKGPMAVAERVSKYVLENGVVQVVEIESYRPYIEFVPCWDYYPDMSAKNFEQMGGEFQRHVYSRQQLVAMGARSDFDGDVIRHYVESTPDGNYQKASHETLLDSLGGQASQGGNANPGCKFEMIEYWGATTGDKLRAAGVKVEDGDLDQAVRYTAWTLEGRVVKVALNPYPQGTKVFHQFVFEEDEVNLLGSGLPPIMRDSQLAVASFSRMLIDNASAVCGPNIQVNIDRMSPSQTNFDFEPFKIWKTEDNGQSTGDAVKAITIPAHINELLAGMQKFDQFADGETFVSPMTGGDMDGVSGEAMRTTGGASMIWGNAALPFKDIVRNYDRFTVGLINSLVQFNRILSPDSEDLQGDVRPVARGATSLMAKEIRAFALDQFATTLSPEEKVFMNMKAFLRERMKVKDLSPDDLFASDEEVKQRQDSAAQQAQTQQQQAATMFDATLKQIGADTMKALSQAQKNLDNADVALTKANVDVFKAINEALANGASPDELIASAQRTRQAGQTPRNQPAATSTGGLPAPSPRQDLSVVG